MPEIVKREAFWRSDIRQHTFMSQLVVVVRGEMPSGVRLWLSQLLRLRSVLSGKSESVRGADDRALRR